MTFVVGGLAGGDGPRGGRVEPVTRLKPPPKTELFE